MWFAIYDVLCLCVFKYVWVFLCKWHSAVWRLVDSLAPRSLPSTCIETGSLCLWHVNLGEFSCLHSPSLVRHAGLQMHTATSGFTGLLGLNSSPHAFRVLYSGTQSHSIWKSLIIGIFMDNQIHVSYNKLVGDYFRPGKMCLLLFQRTRVQFLEAKLGSLQITVYNFSTKESNALFGLHGYPTYLVFIRIQ